MVWVETAPSALTKVGMTKAGSTGGPAGPRAAKRRERAERLAAALKDNLRRRKAQTRERAAEAGRSGQDPEPAERGADERLINKRVKNKAPPGEGS
jgi:hypothetical protein